MTTAVMDTVRTLLAVTFVVAAATALWDRAAFRIALTTYFVPKRFVPILAMSLPALELVIGASLILDVGTRLAAVAGVVLLSAFTLGLALRILKGNVSDCHCFGGVLRERASSWTVLRNICLMAIAAAIAAMPPSGIESRIDVSRAVPSFFSAVALALMYAQLVRFFSLEESSAKPSNANEVHA